MEKWKKEYEERECQRPRESMMDLEKTEEERWSPQSGTQYGQSMGDHTSSATGPEGPSKINSEELMAEIRELTKDLDKTLQELKDDMDRSTKIWMRR